MGYGKVGVSKERMCSYKHTHNSAMHIETDPINIKNPSLAIPENSNETVINPGVNRIIETPLTNGRKAKVVFRVVVVPLN